MICKHLTKRSYQRKPYIYCRSKKKVITFDDCKKCLKFESRENKGLKKSNKPMKKISNTRAKVCEITPKVRKIVTERDNGRCVLCGRRGFPNAHFVKRSQGGMGIPENIVTLCPDCHYQEDFGKNSKWYEEQIEKYLKTYYGEEWRKEDLVYKKWKGT